MSEVALSEALSSHYDISVLNEPFLLACSRLSKNEELAAIVADEEKLKAYLPGRSIIDPILDFDVKFPTPAYFCLYLKGVAATSLFHLFKPEGPSGRSPLNRRQGDLSNTRA